MIQPWGRAACLLAVGALLAALAGCGGNEPSDGDQTATDGPRKPPKASPLTLTGAGSTFFNPLQSHWFDAYTGEHPGVRVNYQSIGSGGGIQQIKKGTVDFGASDAPLSDKEIGEMPSPVVQFPVTAGCEAIVYNLKGVESGLKLTQEALADIYQGKVKRWNDSAIAGQNPGVALPDAPIIVVHRSDSSGTTYIFTDYLSSVSPQWKTKPGKGKAVEWPAGVGQKGNEGVAGEVQKTEGSIGYVELAYALQTKLTYASLRNQAGEFVAPSLEATTAALTGAADALARDIRSSVVNSPGSGAYGICGMVYVIAYKDQKDAAKGKALVDLLNWAIHDGQKTSADLKYAPLPDAVVKIDEQNLRTVTANGQALLAGR